MRLKAIPFKQEGTKMFTGVIKVGDVLQISRVDVWRKVEEDETEIGYQRQPEPARASKVANFLKNSKKPLMPTSVLLSHRGSLEGIEEHNGYAVINLPEDVTLWIVDGQHRIYGFKRAIEELQLERLKDYELPFVLMESHNMAEEADQFRIINETMKKVRTDLARRILAYRVAALGFQAKKEVREAGRMWEVSAANIISELVKDESSPWFNRVQPPNSKKQSKHTVRELSFSTSLKPILTIWPYKSWTPDKLSKVLMNYWKAWQALVPTAFDDANNYVLMKTPGVFSLHLLFRHVMEVLRSREINDPDVDDFKDILAELGEFASDEYWNNENSAGAAMAGSMKGFAVLADMMEEELKNVGQDVER